jgi:hypothetical protein
MNLTESTHTASREKLAHATALLAQTRTVVKHQRELERITGEHFNLFNILRIDHYEVSTHSPILGDLLNSEGTHGQGAVFLELFIQQVLTHPKIVNREGFKRVNTESARVELEKSLGARTETDGGRLDILLTDRSGNQIAIENKINAVEQDNWVTRYRNGLQTGAPLIYLTLKGESAKMDDFSDKNPLILLSYHSDIIAWLEACRKEVATVPVVRESLTQYLFLVRKLTHQNTARRMNQELIAPVLDSADTLEAFFALRDADTAIRGAIIQRLAERLESRLTADFPMVAKPIGNSAKHDAFAFSTPELAAHQVRAVISFDGANYTQCFFGFEMTNGSPMENLPPGLIVALNAAFGKHAPKAKSSGKWPSWSPWEARYNWDDSVLTLIQFGKSSFDDEVLSQIDILKETARLIFAAAAPTDLASTAG